MAKQPTTSTEPTSTGTSLPDSGTKHQAKDGSNGKPKRQRKPSPFLRALRRAELLIEDLPREMAIRVAEHALFIARGLPEPLTGDQCDGRIPFNELSNV